MLLNALALLGLECAALAAMAYALIRGRDRIAGPLLHAGPFLLLGAMAVRMATHWDGFPTQMALHFRFDGQADRWTEKSPQAVFGLLGIGLGVCLLQALIGALIHRTRLGLREAASPEVARRARQSAASVLVAAQYLVAVLFSLILLASTGGHPFPAVIAGAALGLFLAWTAFALIQQARALSAWVKDPAAPDGWRGTFYANPDDPALVVAKRRGVGYTLNFAHPVAWVLLAIVLAFPFVLAFVLRPR